jgi:hypothetical protein
MKKPIHSNKERQWLRALRRTAKEHGLCLCSPEIRKYSSQAEIEQDKRPAVKCDKCGLEKVVAALIFPKGIPDSVNFN